jgi:hypothetical protein
MRNVMKVVSPRETRFCFSELWRRAQELSLARMAQGVALVQLDDPGGGGMEAPLLLAAGCVDHAIHLFVRRSGQVSGRFLDIQKARYNNVYSV